MNRTRCFQGRRRSDRDTNGVYHDGATPEVCAVLTGRTVIQHAAKKVVILFRPSRMFPNDPEVCAKLVHERRIAKKAIAYAVCDKNACHSAVGKPRLCY